MLKYENFDHFIRVSINNLKCHKFRMLCISLYCLLSSGCGVKVKAQSSDDDGVRRPGLESSIINVSNSNNVSNNYQFQRLGDVFIPEKLQFLSGNNSEQARLYFAKGDPVEELYCLYENTDNSDQDLEFIDCYTHSDYDNDGLDDSLNYQYNYSIFQSKEHIISIESDSNSIIVDAQLDINWY